MKFDSVLNNKLSIFIGIVITVLFAFIARFFSTYTIHNSEIDYYESKVKDQLPYYLGYIGSITYVYNTQDDIVYICEVNETNVSIEKLKSNMKGTRQNCELSLLSNTGYSFFNLLAKYNKGVRVIYKGKKESVEVRFSADEIKKMANDKIEPKKLAFDFLENYVSDKNAICPIKLSDNLFLVEMKLDKNTFYYYHSIKESEDLSLDNFKQDISLLEFLNYSTDKNVKSVGRKVAIAGLDVKLIYTSSKTRQQKCYSFTNKQLNDALMQSVSE